MNSKTIAAFLSAMVLCAGLSIHAQDRTSGEFRRAVDLYEHGMFERAGTLFGEIASETDDVLARGYQTLCAIRLQENGYLTMAEDYVKRYPYSKLVPQVHFYNGLNYFDKEEYKAAAAEFGKLDDRKLDKDQVAEYMFKKA